MFKKFIYFFAMLMVVMIWSFNTHALPGSDNKTNKQRAFSVFNSLNNNREELRPVLTVTPREINMGNINADETAMGEYSLKNISPGALEWSASCPDDWEVVGGKTLRGRSTNEPTNLRMELSMTEGNANLSGEKTKSSTYRIRMKLEVSGEEIICQKDLKAGSYRKAIKIASTGGQRTVFIGFRIRAAQSAAQSAVQEKNPSVNLNPQHLDLGVQLPGKIISKRIELTNKGREMLRWSVVPAQLKSAEFMKELQKERYFSFQNEDLLEAGKYSSPEHLKDAMDLIGQWTEKKGYPVNTGTASAIKFRFHGTGISVFLQSHTDNGDCSIYLDDVLMKMPDILSGKWEKKELLIAEGLTEGPHTVTIAIREGSLEMAGVKIFGKEIMRGPRGWITVFPNSGTTMSETDYINVKVNTSNLVPGYYGDLIIFKTNVGEIKTEVYVDIISGSGNKVIDVYLYSKDHDYLYTADPQLESRRLMQNGYVKEGIAFRLFTPNIPGTTSFYRWYNPALKDHYYHHARTGGGKKLNGYIYEGVIGNIATSRMSNTRELYRWFNPSTRKHYYSTNPKGAIGIGRGYRFEGIAGYVR